ncbi:alpha/beta hydrolase family protein [Streptomyces nigra]|uniref:alpha/beta hydrolase family protein n=1 Tax=Streptomyces nigra TaxID=1827580 RepID=UPI0036856961
MHATSGSPSGHTKDIVTRINLGRNGKAMHSTRHTDKRRVDFTGSQGEKLAARLDLPEGSIKAYALFVHCFTCGKESVATARISKMLTQHGIGVLRFDFTGLGESDGDFSNTNFSSNVEDLVCAANHLRENFAAPQLLIGHSLGGAAVLAGAKQIPEVCAVATIGAPAEPSHVRHLFGDSQVEIQDGEAPVQIGGKTFLVRRQFLEDLALQSQRERISSLRLPLMVVHSPADEIVGIDNARIIFETARHPKSFISVDGADHLLRKRRDAQFVADIVASWASRYLA